MEDTRSLVTIFLQKIFHDRQHVIDTTYKLIYDYNNGDRKKVNYEKTLKSICTQLGKEIPNQVLVYLLTLVDMPLDLAESDDSQLKPVIEKIKTLEEIQKTQSCLADSIKPHLEDCVGSSKGGERDEKREQATKGKMSPESIKTDAIKKEEIKKPDLKSDADEPPIQKPQQKLTSCSKKPHSPDEQKRHQSTSKVRRKVVGKAEDVRHRNKSKDTVETLLDLSAVCVIKNHRKLKKSYQRKFEKAWNLIKSNRCTGAFLEQVYETLRDLNKKRKLLRDIENDNITEEVVAELYQDVDIFLKEKHVYDVVNMDLFEYVIKQFNSKQTQ